MKAERKLYELTPSQEVVKMQLLFSLDKRVINIVSSATINKSIDVEVMKQAINLVVERNDCLRLRFVKKGFKLLQYFDENASCDEIPVVEFKTQNEQENFIQQEVKKPIKYLKDKVIEFTLCKTYDKKDMLFVKVCHYVLDTYGIMVILKDVFNVYEALVNKSELPSLPGKFEEIVKKEIEKKNDKQILGKRLQFFKDYFKDREEPYYAGVSGLSNKRAVKSFKSHNMKMFCVKNQTKGYMKEIPKELVQEIIYYCEQNNVTPSSLMFYASALTLSKMNNNVKNIFPLELCNCRATALDRKCAGTKVQSLGTYIELDERQTVVENFAKFCKNKYTFYRYIGVSDVAFQHMTHKIWKSSPTHTYYPICFSFIPMSKAKDVDFRLYSNGKFALPCYLGIMFDVDELTMRVIYDAQTKLINENDVDFFQKNYQSVIKQIIINGDKKIEDIKVDTSKNIIRKKK